MKNGKVKDTVLIRSVFKLNDTGNEAVVAGPAIGRDAACTDAGDRYMLAATAAALENNISGPEFAVVKASNNILACGGTPVSANVAFLLSSDYKEKRLKAMTSSAVAGCKSMGVALAGGHTEVTDAVAHDVMTVTVNGFCEKDAYLTMENITPGLDIVVSKWMGIEGTVIMYEKCREALVGRMPETYVDKAYEFRKLVSVAEEAGIALKHGVVAMHDISDGGIFGALWEMAECSGCGFKVDLRAIPLKQETVEFCEVYGTNPYRMKSTGSLLMVTGDGAGLVDALMKAGINAALIGRTCDDNDKIIINNDEIRYLERA